MSITEAGQQPGPGDTAAIDEIVEVLLRHTRGVDRWDWPAVESCYHADGVINYGVMFQGQSSNYVKMLAARRTGQNASTAKSFHTVTNPLVRVNGDRAVSESYFRTTSQNAEGALSIFYGRYVDSFERRDGRWAVAKRVCVMDLGTPGSPVKVTDFEQGHTSPDDASDEAFRWLSGR